MRPLLEVFGRVFHVGEQPGLGQLMKLANNFLSATAIAATAEAVMLGVKGGLDPATMLEVINASTGRNTASEDKFPRQILTGRYAAGFTTGLLTKDLGLCAAAAAALGVPMPVAETVHARWQRALAELGADADMTRFVSLVEEDAGARIVAAKDPAEVRTAESRRLPASARMRKAGSVESVRRARLSPPARLYFTEAFTVFAARRGAFRRNVNVNTCRFTLYFRSCARRSTVDQDLGGRVVGQQAMDLLNALLNLADAISAAVAMVGFWYTWVQPADSARAGAPEERERAR